MIYIGTETCFENSNFSTDIFFFDTITYDANFALRFPGKLLLDGDPRVPMGSRCQKMISRFSRRFPRIAAD